MLKGLLPLFVNLLLFAFFLLSVPQKKRARSKKKKNAQTNWPYITSYLVIMLFFVLAASGLIGAILGVNTGGKLGKLIANFLSLQYGWFPAFETAITFIYLSLTATFSKLTTKKISTALWLNLLAFLITMMFWTIFIPPESPTWNFAKFTIGLMELLGRPVTFTISLILAFVILKLGLNINFSMKFSFPEVGSVSRIVKSWSKGVLDVVKKTGSSRRTVPATPKTEGDVDKPASDVVGAENEAKPSPRQIEIRYVSRDGEQRIVMNPEAPPETPTPVDMEERDLKKDEPLEKAAHEDIYSSILQQIRVPFERLISILSRGESQYSVDEKELKRNARLIEEKLEEFGVRGKVVAYHPGPVVTRYEYELAPGIKLSKILNLSDDLALRMKTHKIRIVAPLADKGLIGIEVPNRKRRIVYLRELLEQKEFREKEHKLFFALGVDTGGKPFYTNLARMPHLLIAGATGSGKSVSINTIISSFLFRATPSELRMLLIDPKRIELSYYEGVPHLLLPVVKDRKDAGAILKQAVMWMELRYKHFAKDGVRDIESHNRSAAMRGDTLLPYIVIIIDEFADLILTIGKEIEEPLARLAQMARAVGIHLIVATQRPSVDVITGIIKANFPVRIAFKVPSKVDSRTILDEMGAEKLLGMGDMLFIPPGSSEPIRLHGPFVSEEETRHIAQTYTKIYLTNRLEREFGRASGIQKFVKRVIDNGLISALTRDDEPGSEERFKAVLAMFSSITGIDADKAEIGLKKIRSSYYIPIPEMKETKEQMEREAPVIEGLDPLIKEAVRLATTRGEVSATMLQRKLRVGFARAARIIDQMEELGIVTPQEGSRARRVMMSFEEAMKLIRGG